MKNSFEKFLWKFSSFENSFEKEELYHCKLCDAFKSTFTVRRPLVWMICSVNKWKLMPVVSYRYRFLWKQIIDAHGLSSMNLLIRFPSSVCFQSVHSLVNCCDKSIVLWELNRTMCDYFNWDNSHSIELELRRCHFVNEIKLIVYQLKSCVMKLNQFSHDKTMSCLKSKHQRFLMISIFPSKTVEEAINEILVNIEQDCKCLLEFNLDF